MLLPDEPTAALGLMHAYEVMGLLHRLTRNAGRRVVVILHAINLAARLADRIVALKSGVVTFDGTPQALLESGPLSALLSVNTILLDRSDGRRHAVMA